MYCALAWASCGPNSVAAQIPPPMPTMKAIDFPTGENDVEDARPGSLTVAETNGNRCLEIVAVWGSLSMSTNSLVPIWDAADLAMA